MIRKNSLSGSKSCIILLLVLCGYGGFGQQPEPFNMYDHFLSTQFWLGIRTGVGLTQAHPKNRNNGFSPIDYESGTIRKSYNNFSDPGLFMGLEMNFYRRGFSVSFQPTFKRSNYSYTNELEWIGALESSRFSTTYDVRQRLDIIELPLMFKGDILRSGRVRPFAMVGGFYSAIVSAQKDVEISHINYSSGSPLESEVGTVALGVKNAFQNFYGLGAGIGVNLDYFNIRTIFDVSLKKSLNSITRDNVVQNELVSLGDVNDEINYRDISISLSFVFPFRYVDKQFMPY